MLSNVKRHEEKGERAARNASPLLTAKAGEVRVTDELVEGTRGSASTGGQELAANVLRNTPREVWLKTGIRG